MTIRFYFRKSATTTPWEKVHMIVDVSDGRSYRERTATGISMPIELWDPKRQKINLRACYDQKEKARLTEEIDALRRKLAERYAFDKLLGKIRVGWLADVLKDNKEQENESGDDTELLYGPVFNRFLDSREMVDNRKSHYRVIQSMLHRFEIYNRDLCNKTGFRLTITKMNATLLKEFEEYLLIEKTVMENNMETFKKYGFDKLPRERGQNFVSTTMKELRALFNYIVKEEKLLKASPFGEYKIKQEIYGTPYYLTREEVLKIYEKDYDNPMLNRVRDIFVFQCMTGPRVSDLWEFTPDNIIDGNLQYIPSKGIKGKKVADTVTVPLNATAKKILNEAAKQMAAEGDKRGRLLPFMSQAKYNAHIKDILLLAKIKRKVTVYDSKTGAEKQERICDLASSHMARRTFIGNLYEKVPDPNLIASMSGHSENSISFNRYRQVSMDQKKNLVKLLDKHSKE